MDTWEEVDAQAGVWQIARDMYGSVCLCVANRSRVPVAVTVDTSAASNCIVMGSVIEDGVVRCTISPSKTVVVCVFSPEEDLLPMRVNYITRVLSGGSKSSLAPDEAAEDAIQASTTQSSSIQDWLARRK